MDGNMAHPTADEIYDLARRSDPHISRGTVYRNLNLLVCRGEVLRVKVPDGADHFDSTLIRHYHFYCRNCGRVTDVPDFDPTEIVNVQGRLERTGHTAIEHSVVFSGVCPECSKKI